MRELTHLHQGQVAAQVFSDELGAPVHILRPPQQQLPRAPVLCCCHVTQQACQLRRQLISAALGVCECRGHVVRPL